VSVGTGDFGGRIVVQFRLDGDRVADVHIQSSRPISAIRVLEGLPAQQAIDLLPRLFSICGVAHQHAALAACERAAGQTISAKEDAARTFLLLAETAREHARRVLLDWPAIIGEPPAIEPLRLLRDVATRLERALFPTGPWARLGGGMAAPDIPVLRAVLARLEAALADAVLGEERFHIWPDLPSFERWCRNGKTAPARALGWVLDQGLGNFGCSDVGDLPPMDAAALDTILSADTADAFAAMPTWNGRPCLTGSLTRMRGHPLIAALTRRDGDGLLPLLVARLVELLSLAGEMRALIPRLEDDDARQPMSKADGKALALVEMSRGTLIHWVALEGDQVARYRIVAPTEWNFHPRGALFAGLLGVRATTAEALRARAVLLVAALDPCVTADVRLPELDPNEREPLSDMSVTE